MVTGANCRTAGLGFMTMQKDVGLPSSFVWIMEKLT